MTHKELDLFYAAHELGTGLHGKFAALIGDAYLMADRTNSEKLVRAFPAIFEKGHQAAHPKLARQRFEQQQAELERQDA